MSRSCFLFFPLVVAVSNTLLWLNQSCQPSRWPNIPSKLIQPLHTISSRFLLCEKQWIRSIGNWKSARCKHEFLPSIYFSYSISFKRIIWKSEQFWYAKCMSCIQCVMRHINPVRSLRNAFHILNGSINTMQLNF